jgi:subtilase family serine protease
MSKPSNKLFIFLSAVALGMLNIPAQATTSNHSLPKGMKLPRPPYILVSKRATATPGGYSPAQILKAYNYPTNFQGAGETIAIVDSNDDPNIESDLATFSAQFGLPACTTANGCFKKMFANGQPAPDSGWGIEISLDVEWAHAMAPQAKIILVEASDPSDLYFAVSFAIAQHPSVISLSWGEDEGTGENELDPVFQASTVPIFAASGDQGTNVWYPAVSPYVVGVGGTQMSLDSSGNVLSEVAWSGSGGGVSTIETEPAYQKSYVIAQTNGMRGVPDVAYNASGSTPYAVYDSFGEGGWLEVAGTSAGTPQWAALTAIMKEAKKGNFGSFDTSIYSVAREFSLDLTNQITSGTNGSCGFACTARSGYNTVTGLGSPNVGNLINRFD